MDQPERNNIYLGQETIESEDSLFSLGLGLRKKEMTFYTAEKEVELEREQNPDVSNIVAFYLKDEIVHH